MNTTIRGAGREPEELIMGKWAAQGYTVSPGNLADLPESLRNYQPDFVAIRDDDKVAVGILVEGDYQQSDKWVHLSAAVEDEPGWRFELLMLRWDPESHPYSGFETLSKQDIESRLAVAEQLDADHCFDAELLTLSLALEAAARYRFELEDHVTEDVRTSALISRLYNDGYIDEVENAQLLQSMTIRNTILHGYQNIEIQRSLLPTLKRIIERLIATKN